VFSAHCHNDLGLAVANSLAAMEGGARQIECTINGIGERAGNAALEELVMALKVRNAFYNIDSRVDTRRLVPTSQLLQRLIGMPVQRNKAIVGENAFAHESGIHQHGMLRNRNTYEIMNPSDVGWPDTKMVLGRHSGRAALEHRRRALGYTMEDEQLDQVFAQFKALCEQQRVVEDDDLERLINGGVTGQGFRLSSMTISDRGQRASAQVELSDPEGRKMSESALGDGPVDALFAALANATGVKLSLESYSVHSVGLGADAQGEATLSVHHDGVEYQGSGISRDIIEASALAWLDVANRILRRNPGRTPTADARATACAADPTHPPAARRASDGACASAGSTRLPSTPTFDSMQADIVVLPGDGIGPEIVSATVPVLEAVARRFGHQFRFAEHDIGGIAIDRHGEPLPAAT